LTQGGERAVPKLVVAAPEVIRAEIDVCEMYLRWFLAVGPSGDADWNPP
jgi:hypothetical protein